MESGIIFNQVIKEGLIDEIFFKQKLERGQMLGSRERVFPGEGHAVQRP